MNPPLNILLAEDERSVASSISFALKCDGHKVEVANDSEHALARLMTESSAFDLLITDNNMPRMTGIELVRRLRGTSSNVKILVVSAHLSPENRAAYDALGVDGMVPKPFDVLQLRALIRQVAKGGDAPVQPQPERLHLSRAILCNLFESALLKPDEPEEPMGLG